MGTWPELDVGCTLPESNVATFPMYVRTSTATWKPPGTCRIIEEECQPKLFQGRQRTEHELFTVSNAVKNRSYASVHRMFHLRG
jgi:hypothetical protein